MQTNGNGQGGEVTTRPQKPTDIAKALLDNKEVVKAFADSLPRGMTPDRFRGVVLLAVAKEPKLIEHPQSLLMSCRQCAADGLMPDGREAALVVYRTQDPPRSGNFVNKVQYIPMVAGLIKLARNSGEIGSLSARVVYTADTFDVTYGDDERIEHRPNLDDENPTIRAVYAIAKLRDGSIEREVMTVAQVEKIRAKSKAKDSGPWADHYEEMARKTVLRRIMKRLPRSSELERALERGDDDIQDTTAVEHAPSVQPALPPRSRADKIAMAIVDEALEPAPVHETVTEPATEPLTPEQEAQRERGRVLAAARQAKKDGIPAEHVRHMLTESTFFSESAVNGHMRDLFGGE